MARFRPYPLIVTGMPEDMFSMIRDVLTEEWAKVKDKKYVHFTILLRHPSRIKPDHSPPKDLP